MISIPVVPYVADIMGRRAGIIMGCCIMLFGVALVSIGSHVALFIVGRMILGFGLGIAQVGYLACLKADASEAHGTVELIDITGMLSSAGGRVGPPPAPGHLQHDL